MSISPLQKNLLASLVGNGLTALVAMALVPLYIRFLGLEAWGLIGIFASLQGICALLDLGLSATLNREMARLSVRGEKAQEMRDLTRTLELIYWGIAVVIGILLFALAPLVAHHWVQANQLPTTTIQRAIRMMGLAICLQWPFGLYSGGLLGLQRQVLLSCTNVAIATLRGLGAIVILSTFSASLSAFFLWQVVINLLQTCLAGFFLWRSLPHTDTSPIFQRKLIYGTWRFTVGISATTVASVILSQMDKVILTRLLPLEAFGYYIIAGTVATSISLLVLPVFSVLYPKFTQLVSLGDHDGLRHLYHSSCQLMSVLILPISIVIAFFSKEILFLWTGNVMIVEHTHLILSILVIGSALNGLMHLPYALQLAYGWTTLALYTTVVAVLVLAPLTVYTTSLYGAVGAASVWVIFNGGAVLVATQLMHRRLQKGEKWKWYAQDVGVPLVVSIGAGLLCLALAPTGGPRPHLLIVLMGVTMFVAGAACVATPVTRLAFIRYWKSRRRPVLNVS